MLFESRRARRRRELLEGGFGPDRQRIAARRIHCWPDLTGAERNRLGDLALDLMAGKRWEAANGFELTEEIMVTIAAQAALLILGLPDDSYRLVGSIIVHPTTLVLTGEHHQGGGIASREDVPILGLAEHRGAVLITWDAVLNDARHPGNGHNVVFHEFAHQLDMLDGTSDGTPPLATREQFDEWVAVCTRVYRETKFGRGGPVLDPYAGISPSEFFAVATEAFFDRPRDLRHDQPDLYRVLAAFYRQNPAERGP